MADYRNASFLLSIFHIIALYVEKDKFYYNLFWSNAESYAVCSNLKVILRPSWQHTETTLPQQKREKVSKSNTEGRRWFTWQKWRKWRISESCCRRKDGRNPHGGMRREWQGDVDGCRPLLRFLLVLQLWKRQRRRQLSGTGGGRKTVGEGKETRATEPEKQEKTVRMR